MGKPKGHRYVVHSPLQPQRGTHHDQPLLGVVGIHQGAPDYNIPSTGRNAFNSERPLNVKPTDQGGVAIDGRGDPPEGHANMADKVIGKVQKVSPRPVPAACSGLISSFFFVRC